MEHYLAYTDYPIWEVIQRGNGPVSVSTDTNGLIKVLPPKTAKEILARERERKARTTLLMALPEDHLAKFHKMTDAKEMWEAIKSRFGGNDESKKMQKYILKQQFEGFSVSNSEGLHKGYDVSKRLDEFDLEEIDLKWQVAMISIRMKKFYKKTGRKLQFDVKEPVGFDKTKVKCYSCHKTGHFARECKSKGNQDSRRRDTCNTGNKDKENGRRYGKQEDSKALVTLDGEGVDWTSHSKDEQENYALMACSSSGSDTEVTSCSKEYKESYAKLKKLYDEQKEQLRDASIEIQAYTQALKKVEAQLVAHKQSQLWYEEKIRFMKIDLDDKTDILTYHKKLSAEAEKEKEDLKAKVEKWHNSSKNLNILLNISPSVFVSRKVSIELSVNDRYAVEMHAVPPPNDKDRHPFWTDKAIDDFTFTYGRSNLKLVNMMMKQWTLIFFSHLIRDCDFHEKRMAKQAELNNGMSKGSSQREIRPVWNNVQRMNHQNQFVPTTVQTRTGKIPVNTAKTSGTNTVNTVSHNFNSQAVQINADRKVNTVKPIVNNAKPKAGFHKSVSPFRKSFNRTTTLRTNFSKQKVNTAEVNAVSAVKGKRETADYPHRALQNKGIVDSGCSRHMTGNKAYLTEYQDFNGGPVAFGGSKGYITGKGKIKTGKLDFEDVCFVKELQHFNLFSVSQMCDKKNKVLFTDTECLVLSPEFKLPDENQVLLRIPRQNNMYSFNLENIVPSGGLACLIAKATIDESNKWHRRLGHVNFKNLNKLVKGNLVRGLPSKIFQNDHTCVACQKGKQHKASCKAKSVSSISQPLQLLHMDLFGPTSVRSLNHKTYCLVITDDFSRFSWVFFLRTKDETSGILKDFIRQIENQLNQKVKTIRCDNGTEFKNRDFIEFCGSKGIKREYSNARTPQQNGVAERKNRTLIEAARTMLADSFLPNTFWAEAVSTACYVLNRVLVTKPQNKTPYELITGKIPIISYIRPFGCHVTILNTIDHLGKFDGKSDEGFLVGYSLQSKAFRVYNLETKRVEENLHITFLENKPNVAGKGPTWLFDLDYLTDSMNYQPVRSENQANKHAGPKEANHNVGTEDNIDAGDSEIEAESAQDYNVLPNEKPVDKEDQVFLDELERLKRQEHDANDAAEALRKEFAQDTEDLLLQAGAAKASSTNIVNTASTPVSTASPYGGLSFTDLTNTDQDDSEIPPKEYL
ncbi:putative ribonuclease H-like domain-containing protein [Tanacetum coccineum]